MVTVGVVVLRHLEELVEELDVEDDIVVDVIHIRVEVEDGVDIFVIEVMGGPRADTS